MPALCVARSCPPREISSIFLPENQQRERNSKLLELRQHLSARSMAKAASGTENSSRVGPTAKANKRTTTPHAPVARFSCKRNRPVSRVVLSFQPTLAQKQRLRAERVRARARSVFRVFRFSLFPSGGQFSSVAGGALFVWCPLASCTPQACAAFSWLSLFLTPLEPVNVLWPVG